MIPTTTLSNNIEMPLIGLGTTHSGGYYHDAVLHSINKCGYRLIDTAKRYGVERQLGIALKGCSVPREEMFLCTKLWPVDCGDGVFDAFRTSCEKLQSDYLDLYMIHMPHLPDWIRKQKETREETWRQMELLYEDDHVRSIGVSNYSIEDLEELSDFASVLPHANQIEFHPWFHQNDLKSYSDELGVLTMGYCPLAKGKYLDDEILCQIANKHGKSPAQICLRWSVQQNVPTVPKSTDTKRLEENTNVFDFELSEEDLAQLSSFSSQKKKIVDLSNICSKMSLPDGYKLNGRVFGVPEESSEIPRNCSECARDSKVSVSVCI
uniref:Aldo_ket_red domain-containing protein n=1 Tax=Caenorhabditis japonica TaxID=281687 RepID=A0A8R1HNL3_CAEJA